MKLGEAMKKLYSHKGYGCECIDDREAGVAVGLFTNKHEARICIGLVAEDPRSFSTLEKRWGFDREFLEKCMVSMFEMLDQSLGDPWLWDVRFDCLTVYEHANDQVLCRLHMDIDEDMEV